MMDCSKLKINCLGASNTKITKTEEKETIKDINYPLILGLLLRCTVRNSGIGGTNIAVQDGRSDSYYERAASMDRDADIVIMQGDGNDASHGLPLGVPGCDEVKTFCGAVKGCIGLIRNNFPDAKIIILAGMKKQHQPKRDDGATHEDFHRAFIETCRLCGIEPYDFSKDPSLTWERPDMMPDGLHMSEKGCRHYADAVAELVKKAVE